MLAAWAACSITKESSRRGFEKYGRSLLTSNILEEIGAAFAKFSGGERECVFDYSWGLTDG